MPIKAKFLTSSHNWAQTAGIVDRNFIFCPCWDGSGSTLANFGNAGGSSFTITAPNNSPWATAGKYTGDGDAGTNPDTTFIESTNADVLSLFKFMGGATDGIGGRSLLLAWTHTTPAVAAAGAFVCFGNPNNTTEGYGWVLRGTTAAIIFQTTLNGSTSGATSNALINIPAVNTEYKLVILMNAKTGGFEVHLNGVSQSLSTSVATLLTQMDSAVTTSGAQVAGIFTGNSGTNASNAVTPQNVMTGKMRNVFAMDATDMTSAQVTRFVTEYQQMPHYTVPRYLSEL